MKEEIRKWQENSFTQILADMGIKEGSIVVDFGCGVGNYTFSVSCSVGEKGRVYAIDKNQAALDQIRVEMIERKVQNIISVQPEHDGRIPLEDCSADMVMIYDLIHDLGQQRQRIISECKRILKMGGILSVAPFHMQKKHVIRLVEEMGKSGFAAGNVLERKALHFEMHRYLYNASESLNDYEKGNIYNFIKI